MGNVEWDTVEPIAEKAFSIWVGHPERHWAKQAWAHLAAAGLTSNDDPLDWLRACIRFLVLASLYRDWCALVFDEVEDDRPQSWLSAVEVHPFHIGQLIGEDVVVEDPDGGLDEPLNELMCRDRKDVVAAIVKGFGGAEGLFASLWTSRGEGDEQSPSDREDSDEDEVEEMSGYEALNDYTPEKAAGLEWAQTGCDTLGPQREHAEFDGMS